MQLNDKSSYLIAYFGAILLCAACFLVLLNVNDADYFYTPTPNSTSFHIQDNNQYAYLADALLRGSVSLGIDPPQWLVDMDNPYDIGQRMALAESSGEYALWDYAFYDGKYYCYFGVVPAVMLFVPFKLITGTSLSTPAAIGILGILVIIAAVSLLFKTASHWYKRTIGAGSLFLIALLFCSGLNVMYLGFASFFYSIPILSSLLVTSLGLLLWINAKEALGESKPAQARLYLFFGTLLMCLNFGCRPQFVISCALALPLFWEELFVSRTLFSRKSLLETGLVLAAIVVTIAPLMAYNYVRFGSVLNFGSSYNLTGFDMTTYEQGRRTTLSLLYSYLIQPPHFSSHFPFIAATQTDLSAGWAPNEPMFGGYFWLAPLTFALALIPFALKQLKQSKQVLLIGASLLCAVIVLVVDTLNAGITQRYFSDFGFFLMLASALAIFGFIAHAKELAKAQKSLNTIRLLNGALAFALVISVFIGATSFVSPERYYSIQEMNPTLYSYIAS